MESIKEILIRRDGMTADEAETAVDEAKEAFWGYLKEGNDDAAHNICEQYFGLEPDYIMEFI